LRRPGRGAGNEGDASVPSHHIRHPRPYGCEVASEATSPNTYPCKFTLRPYGKTWFHPPELDAYGVIPLVALLDIGQ